MLDTLKVLRRPKVLGLLITLGHVVTCSWWPKGCLMSSPLGHRPGLIPSRALCGLTRPSDSAQAITTSIRSISAAAAKPVVGRFPYPDGNDSTRPIAIGA